MIKKHILLLFCIISMTLSACAPKAKPMSIPPIQRVDGINFIQLHNYVIDGLMEEEVGEFFFVVNNSVDISGDNEKKEITLKCTVHNRTTVEDLDLFLSMAIRLIGDGCHEQDNKYRAPEMDANDGNTYTTFGSVFNSFRLILDCKTEDGRVLRDDNIAPGAKIPIDPRYWRE